MSILKNNVFKTADGVNAYDPDVVSAELAFKELVNLEARQNRLFASRGLGLFQDLGFSVGGDLIVGFGYYFLSSRQFTNLYAFSESKIYWFDFEAGEFDDTPIYTWSTSRSNPPVVLQWFDSMYVTRPGGPYLRVVRKTATPIADAPYARYGIVANSHAMLGNVGKSTTNNLARIQWSDLDAPEDFVINPNASEADFFDLEPSSLQITGMSYQRGSPIVYSQDDIWIGTYVGFPGSFKWQPLYTGIGNIFHDAVVRYKEIDYFIAADNIYQLNGLQIKEIGDKIFKRFIEDVKIGSDTSVRGYVDSRKDLVFWVYTDNDDNLQTIVYNPKEDKWTQRDPQDLTGWLDTPRFTFRGYQAIDDIDTLIDDDSDLIDDPDAGFPLVLPQLAGSINEAGVGVVAKADNSILKLNGDEFDHEIETFDFYFDEMVETKEVNRATIEYKGQGTPNLTIEIGSRSSQNDDVTWSTPTSQVIKNGTISFFFRSDGVGKFLRFRFRWNNTEASYIDDIRFVTLNKVEDADDTPEK